MTPAEFLDRYDRLAPRMGRAEFREMFAAGRELVAASDGELADSFGVSHPTIARWASGDTAPGSIARWHYLRKLSRLIVA